MTEATTHYGACNLCEAICGLEFKVQDGKILSVRGDDADPFSRGHVCPKAVALKDLHEDPDRLRHPVRRTASGWERIGWDEAYAEVARRLHAIREQHGSNSVASYLGNPSVHNYGNLTHGQNFLGLLKTRNRFSATSVDQLPHQLVAYWMFGHQLLLPIPDIDRTQHFLVLGANPMASNGSLMTVPDFRGRLKELKARGGRMIVIDPRRTETAAVADAHHFIRPGTDVALLLAMLHVLFADDRVRLGRLGDFTRGLETVRQAIVDFTPEAAARITGIDADTIRKLARDFSDAPRAVAYGRVGLSTQAYGSLCQWALNLLNIVSGNVDREGGAMFTLPAVDLLSGQTNPGHFDVWKSRVRGLPEFGGELPVAALAEEILTPGDGQVRGLVTVAGNPVLSTPNGRQLEQALSQLDFMVSIDFYVNETTRHAHMILPPTCGVEHDHYDLIFHHLAVRNTTRYTPALVSPDADTRHDWQIHNGLARAYRAQMESHRPESIGMKLKKLPGLARQSLRPDQLIDLGLRLGPYGRWKRRPERLSLRRLKQHPHGLDLGALQPSLPARLFTADNKIRCDVPELLADLDRARALLDEGRSDSLRLIGRRHLRSNNSWMHNAERLVKGKGRCQLLMHPNDAATRGLADGARARIASRVGELEAEVLLTEDMMPGVVSLPHGWGHSRPGVNLRVAQAHPGVSLNDLTDDQFLDPLSGNASFSGVEVSVESLAG
ncbi:MAG: molybdopterin oxidoreductase family protein [Panacagrimonas sp.]|jgi:anaerobic selenocysteine-containing dehydrogenase|nr:molybdopterin oxidoreductase family protein [Panacagrimonas sp.]MCC2657042.1 molybdopterin oxidoreductase family protein [Panacagrimonas sp.]